MSRISGHRRSSWRALGCSAWLASFAAVSCGKPSLSGTDDTLASANLPDPTRMRDPSTSPDADAATMNPAGSGGEEAGGAGGSAGSLAAGSGGSGPDAGATPSVTTGTGALSQGLGSAGSEGGELAPPVGDSSTKPVLFWLDITADSVWSANADGTNKRMLITAPTINSPDSIAVDVQNNFVYWTNMGIITGGGNLGSVQRMSLDGRTLETIVPVGATNTPTQVSIDAQAQKLYWCDREGARIYRSDLDGGNPEVLVSGHGMLQLVGLALDPGNRQLYFSDRMTRKIFRAGFDIPSGEDADTRSDIEELYSFGVGSMPLDIDVDLEQRKIYWTDRLRGVVARGGMDLPSGQTPANRTDIETVATNVIEPVGVALDHVAKQLYYTQLSGEVWRAEIDGSNARQVVSTGSASGVTLVHLPE